MRELHIKKIVGQRIIKIFEFGVGSVILSVNEIYAYHNGYYRTHEIVTDAESIYIDLNRCCIDLNYYPSQMRIYIETD